MEKHAKNWLCVIIAAFFFLEAFPQDDSLIYYYNHPSKINAFSAGLLLKKYTLKDSLKIKEIVLKIPKKEDKVAFYHGLGERFYDEDNYEGARFYFTKALEVARFTLDKKIIADQFQSLGDIYRLQDQATTALDYLLQAMYIYKELGQEKELAHTLGIIGDVNRCIEQYQDALKYLNEALDLTIKNNYIKDEAFCYSSLGATYQELKDYQHAFASENKGLSIAKKINDTMRIIDFNYSIGDLLTNQEKIPEAINYLEEAVKLCNISGDKYYLGFCHMGLSKAYLKKNDYDRSLKEGLIAYKIGEDLKTFAFCSEASGVLYEAYAKKNDFKNAYKYLKFVKDNADSSMSNANIKQQAQMEINFKNSFQEKQDSLMRFEQDKQKDIIQQEELKQQKIWSFAGIAGLLMAIIVVLIVFRFYKKEKRSRQIINRQKIIVDSKNKEIVDSINYAKKIQQAMIPTTGEVKNIFPESFVLLLPKDIVSGDFYWVAEKEKYSFAVVADCTGHGVPGGFMSMLGTTLLNEIINEKNIYEPSDILDMLKLKIIMALRQSDNVNESKDGMDIAVCRIERSKKELTFAGANNALYLLRNNEITELKGDKQPIGISSYNNKQFTQKKISLTENDCVYMITDGYADQFGGPAGKKFKYKQFEEIVMQINKMNMEEQRKFLLKAHNEWRGSLEQVDDICVVGMRL